MASKIKLKGCSIASDDIHFFNPLLLKEEYALEDGTPVRPLIILICAYCGGYLDFEMSEENKIK